MILTHYALLQCLLGTQQSVALAGLYLTQRYARKLSHHSAQVFAGKLGMLILGQVVGYLDVRHGAIEQVDGRCRQRLLGKIALSQADGLCKHSLVGGQSVVLLKRWYHALQNGQCSIGCRFVDADFLEYRCHLLVGLDILSKSVDARCAKQLQTAFVQLVLKYGRCTEQRALLVKQLIDLLDD